MLGGSEWEGREELSIVNGQLLIVNGESSQFRPLCFLSVGMGGETAVFCHFVLNFFPTAASNLTKDVNFDAYPLDIQR